MQLNEKVIVLHTHWMLRKFSDVQIQEINQEIAQKIFPSEKEKNNILCRICKNKISSVDKMIEVNGSHKHEFKNPCGIVYQIGCFMTADGCQVIGKPTTEFTWFTGFNWNLAICSLCFSHMGWFYHSPSESFFGLILENLIWDSVAWQ